MSKQEVYNQLQRKSLKGLKSSHSAFHSALKTLDWAKSADKENLSYYLDKVRTYQKSFDEAKAKFQKELELSNFQTQELINRFK